MRTTVLRRTLATLTAACLAMVGATLITTTTAHAAAAAIGVGLPNLAAANAGDTACATNTLGTVGYDTSCTGNGGQPESWSADFADWVWANEGATTTGLTTTAGGSTPGLFWKYGQAQGTLQTSASYVPKPGDVIVYDTPADYVAIVTQLDPDGSVQITGGDGDGQPPGTSHTTNLTLPAGQTAVGSAPTPMNGKTITGYISPVPLSTANPALTSFGSITWTPPGGATQRTDIYVADAYGRLWDYTHTPGSTPTPLPALGGQAETGWTHYRPVGVGDMNGDGYPDLVAIDTTTNNLDLFAGSATGFSSSPKQIGAGWDPSFRPYGIADYQHTGQLGIITSNSTTGNLLYYPINPTGGASPAPTTIGTGWNTNFVPFGVGDFTGDGHIDVLTCRTDLNTLQLMADVGTNSAEPATIVYTGCNSHTFIGLTAYTTTGHLDLIVRDAGGNILLDPSTSGFGTATSIGTVISTGNASSDSFTPFGAITWIPPRTTTPRVDIFAAFTNGTLYDDTITPTATPAPLPATGTPIETGWTHYRPVGVADWNHDGYPDLIVIDTTTNAEEAFFGSATGFATTPTQLATDWTSNFLPYGIADWNHDGYNDVIATNTNNGVLAFYPGDVTGGGPGNPVTIGTGFDSTYTPYGIADFNGNGHYDILTCRTDSSQLLYPGDYTGGTNPADNGHGNVLLTGCNTDTPIGITPYTTDGRPDLIIRDNTTGNIIVDQTNGTGGWQNATPTTLTTGW